MKFILGSNAPDIPLELQQKQENGELVIFCGAGISCNAGLPNFEKLVSQVYKDLNEDLDLNDEKNSNSNTNEPNADNKKSYDQMLHSLEQQKGKSQVREKIIKHLTLKAKANLATHKALLDLSQTDNGYRLVTTNVDPGFIQAIDSRNLIVHTSPALPIPKKHKWNTLVHLHGLIDEKLDSNGEELIFTSGDFGLAYLVEGWAAHFIVELFRQFTVLFIGYSLNDPVIRYITDAIAAEIKIKQSSYSEPWIILSIEESTAKKSVLSDWKEKGFNPITYVAENSDHSPLHETLIAWAKYLNDRVGTKYGFLQQHAKDVPKVPYEDQEGIGRIVDILKSCENLDCINIIKESPYPIEWIKVLDINELLTVDLPALDYPCDRCKATKCEQSIKVQKMLCGWMAEHLDKEDLVLWIIAKRQYLHPYFKKIIQYKISCDNQLNLPEDYKVFWQIVTSDFFWLESDFDAGVNNLIENCKTKNSLAMNELIELMKPVFVIEKSYYSDISISKGLKPYTSKVTVRLPKFFHREAQNLLQCSHDYLSTLMLATNHLYHAMQLWELISQNTNPRNDHSFYHMQSIAPHDQNKLIYNWAFLIEVCRDLWSSTYKKNKSFAKKILQIWKSFKYPVFRRLILYVYTIPGVINPDAALNYLLSHKGKWLWSEGMRRENCRLLHSICRELTLKSKEKLCEVILSGSSMNFLNKNTPTAKLEKDNDWLTWFFLKKIQFFGLDLTNIANEKLIALSKKYPDWQLREEEKDEFISWSEIFLGYQTDKDETVLGELSIEDLTTALIEESEYHLGRLDSFSSIVKSNPEKAVSVLEIEKNNSDIWEASLRGLMNANDKKWKEISVLVENLDNNIFSSILRDIAIWAKDSTKDIMPDSTDEEIFWKVANKILNGSDFAENISNDAVFYAINHPIGIITEAFMYRLAKRNYKADEGINDRNCLLFLDSIISSEPVAGRIILASRIHYFYIINPAWTEEKLIPRFDFNGENSNEAAYLWQGFLWPSISITINLAEKLSEYLYQAISEKTSFSPDDRKKLYCVFVDICLDYPEIYSQKYQRDLLKTAPDEILEELAFFLYKKIGPFQDNSTYFSSRIMPFIEEAWPTTDKSPKLPRISYYFCLILINLTDDFKNGFNVFKHKLTRLSDESFSFISFINKLNTTKLPDNEPDVIFALLKITFSADASRYEDKSNFKNIITRLISANPALTSKPGMRKFQNFSEE